MKVISWNIGNYIFVQNPLGRSHYSFHIPDLSRVVSLIKTEDADTVFLQEIHTEEDVETISREFPEFKYKTIVYSDTRFSKSLFMSKYEITHIHHTLSDDYIIDDITFFPIHLDAFSPSKRYAKILSLNKDLQNKKSVILGDTNLWIYNNSFISNLDRRSYKHITANHIDILSKLKETCRFFLSLDKVFITSDLRAENVKIVRHAIGYIDHYMIVCDIKKII